MLSLNTPKPFSTPFLSHPAQVQPPPLRHNFIPRRHQPISAAITPSRPNPSQSKLNLYQPFRPPVSPLPPKFRNLNTDGQLEILTNRLGLWFEFAPLISTLIREGFTSTLLEEITGISAIEQNRIVVAAQVHDSLIQSNLDPDILSFFENGGAELLYEIRLLSQRERAESAKFVVQNKLDGEGAQELARSIKDFPRRRGDKGWECFDYNIPSECLSFTYYRQAHEYSGPSEERNAALKKALDLAVTEKARKLIEDDLEGKSKTEKETQIEEAVKVPVVRMKTGEIAEATSVIVLPVCKSEEKDKEVKEAPWECGTKGEFGIVEAEKEWKRWVVLPGWLPLVGLKRGGVAITFPDARALPWKANRWYKEEAIIVVVDRARKEVETDNGFYLVVRDGNGGAGVGGLKVERGSALKELGIEESLGTVLLVIRPPREDDDDQLDDEEWE
ncbi:rubisco accumulation factor 1.1, chloroplastic-like [Impatiens glandulifera]|uniref:rubisco accumulation factor 1.1, chloroplastic-like n=1 Tax=Impatiens glandulifera TaxID=253017 RepID=UPI001FB0F9D2|nr:rubisco accumulation factor 1.1, chloroplastic-like [Impatiens glandulifera]